MRKILITGAGGLIGSHLNERLSTSNTVYTVSRSIADENNINVDFSREWDTSLLPAGLDTIIHLAQSKNFRQFPETAADVFYTNTLSTLKLIDFARETGVRKFIYASSGGIYGTGDKPFAESDLTSSPENLGFYLNSKYMSELVLDNYSNLLEIVQLRFFFVYGRGQDSGMLMPRLVESVKQGKPIILQGAEGITINPVHVEDAVIAIEKAIDLKGSHKINIAGPSEITIKEIGNIIGALTGHDPNFVYEKDKPVKNIIAATDRMKTLLHTPNVKIREGLQSII